MIETRAYQDGYVSKSREEIRNGCRRIIIQADTGSGKTVIACMIIDLAANKGSRSLFLAPARELVNQTSRKLDEFGIDHGIIMAGRGYRSHAATQVSCTPTILSRCIRRNTLALPPADLIIADEVHFQGPGLRELLSRYPRAVIIGLSATPCRTDGKGLGGLNGFQKIIQETSRSFLISQGYIVPTKVYAPYRPDMKLTAEERARGERPTGASGDYRTEYAARRMDKPELVGDIVTQWKKYGQDRPTIAFASSVRHSINIAASFNGAGISAIHLDAGSPEDFRARILGDEHGEGDLAKGKIKVLCNFGVAVTGLDVPAVGTIILARPTKSFIVFKQAVGRGCRVYRGPLYVKDYAILLDHSGCWEVHGLPDQDIDWELDPDKKIEDVLKEKNKNAPKNICCPKCFATFSAREFCPECGHRMAKQRKSKEIEENKNGKLVEIPQDHPHSGSLKSEQLRRFWQRALAIAAARDGTCGMALGIFKRDTGLLPWTIPGLPHVPVGSDSWKEKVRVLFPNYWRGGNRDE